MGLRGSLPSPDSRETLRKNGGVAVELPTPERPVAPAWLKPKAKRLFNELVDQAVASGVPTKVMDSHAFAMAAQYTLDYQEARDGNERARIGRDLMAIYDVIGATPKARLRMNIKPKNAAPSKTAQLLQIAANR